MSINTVFKWASEESLLPVYKTIESQKEGEEVINIIDFLAPTDNVTPDTSVVENVDEPTITLSYCPLKNLEISIIRKRIPKVNSAEVAAKLRQAWQPIELLWQ